MPAPDVSYFSGRDGVGLTHREVGPAAKDRTIGSPVRLDPAHAEPVRCALMPLPV
ncbi:hypothetical protein ACFY1U_10380 [Streptomyces sp. NPDC001351]|uniref:hypothetical protein n=1 Tax=Streptomyces sp. NPDC001351 TaxID=3364564 RepID=UPI00368303BB